MMKIRNLILPILLCVPMLHSQDESEVVVQPPTDIEILLDLVKDSSTLRTKDDQKRLDDFLANKARQQKLLNDARWLLTKEKNREKVLTKTFEDNDKRLSDLEEQLNLKVGTLGETFGVVRQISGDAKSNFNQSLTNLQFPNREAFLGELAQRKALPKVSELEQLWFELLNEMYESGKVTSFNYDVFDTSGSSTSTQVIRVGQFNAVADRTYLRFIPEEQALEFLQKNPPGSRSSLRGLNAIAESGYAEFQIDPTRGSLLSLILQNPGAVERVNQGGIVGYFILVILLAGLIMGAMRFRYLFDSKKVLDAELSSGVFTDATPLKEIEEIISNKNSSNLEQVETKIEAVLSKIGPLYEKNLSTIKLLAAVAPLLGLLGTVIGMIETFQAITLFGTGDPKLMADGISQALVTTMLGLITAVPLLFVHNQLDTRSREIIQIIEEQAIGKVAAKEI